MLHSLRLALNGRIPPFAKSAYLKLRELNAGQRALPDFLIIGAQKAGTTSLFNYLCQHPQVIGSVPKEIFYLCSHPERGERWYRRHFPLRSTLKAKHALCGEASPTYLTAEGAPSQAARTVPQAKCIVLLRDPVERIVSNYYHRFRAGRETRPINEIFSASMIERLAKGTPEGETETMLYQRSDYAGGLRRWLDQFPREQIHVIEAETLFRQPQEVFSEVCRFLGLEPINLPSTEAFNANADSKEKPLRFNELRQAFRQQNHKLAELGYSFSWMTPKA